MFLTLGTAVINVVCFWKVGREIRTSYQLLCISDVVL